MPLHHYLPAAFLSSFSYDTTTFPRRKRILSVGDKHENKIILTPAEKVAAINNFYTLSDSNLDPELIDEVWKDYEASLNDAIKLLISGNTDAKTWIRILVPFVACMLVRGPDFNKRFEQRMRTQGFDPVIELISEDNTNIARFIELQRLIGQVAAAKWIIFHVKGNEPLITNDLGFAPFSHGVTREKGIAIPLDLKNVLAVIPRTQGKIIEVHSGKWKPIIEYSNLRHNNHEGLNEAIASFANRFIFGPNNESINKWLKKSRSGSNIKEPGLFAFFVDPLARAHEFTWHRLAATLERDPTDDPPWDFPLDWEKISHGWCPIVFFPLNLLEFPPALQRKGDSIFVEFYNPEFYYALSRIKELEEMGEFELVLEEATQGLAIARDDDQKVSFLVSRAAAFDKLEKYDEAIKDYKVALDINPKSLIALLNYGVTLMKIDKNDHAFNCFEKILSLDPKFGPARCNLGTILTMQDDPYSGIKEITIALKTLAPGPDQGTAHLSRGDAHLLLNNNLKAVEDFQAAFLHFPDSQRKAFCEYKRAIALLNIRDYEESSKAITHSIELNDGDPLYYIFKGDLDIKQGKNDDAITALSRVLELDSDISRITKAQALDLRAIAYANQFFLDLALQDHNLAVELYDSSTVIHQNRGITLLFLGEIEEAIISFDRALEIDIKNPVVFLNRGIVYLCQGKYELAIKDHQASASIFGKSVEAGSPLRHLALCFAIIENFKEAKGSIKKAREVDPESPFNLHVEALFFLHKGKFYKAKVKLSKFIKKYGDMPDTKIYLSLPLAFKNKTDEALTLAKDCLDNLKYPVTKLLFKIHVNVLVEKFDKNEKYKKFVDRIGLD